MAGLPVCTMGQFMTAACISRGTEFSNGLTAKPVGGFVDENHAVSDKPFKGGRAVVGKGADQLPVVVSVIRKSIGLDHRPVRQVLEKQVRRVHDSVLFLNGRAAAQRNIAAARDRVTADIVLSLDQDHRGTGFPCDYGRGESSCSRTDHHDVRLAMPLGRRLLSSSRRRARGSETASGQSRSDPSAAQK